jgi:dihydroxycyclohexadiene carboxylate dehydrogenase
MSRCGWHGKGLAYPGATEAPPHRVPRNTAPPSEQEKVWYQRIVDQALFCSLMKRFGTTDEQTAAILFLASDEASYISSVPFARGRRRPQLNHCGRTASD